MWRIRQSGAEQVVGPARMLPDSTSLHCSTDVYQRSNDVQGKFDTRALQAGAAAGEACKLAFLPARPQCIRAALCHTKLETP